MNHNAQKLWGIEGSFDPNYPFNNATIAILDKDHIINGTTKDYMPIEEAERLAKKGYCTKFDAPTFEALNQTPIGLSRAPEPRLSILNTKHAGTNLLPQLKAVTLLDKTIGHHRYVLYKTWEDYLRINEAFSRNLHNLMFNHLRVQRPNLKILNELRKLSYGIDPKNQNTIAFDFIIKSLNPNFTNQAAVLVILQATSNNYQQTLQMIEYLKGILPKSNTQ